MGIFSKKYESNNYATNSNLDELRQMVQTIGTKVAIIEAKLEGLQTAFASLRARLNRNSKEFEDTEENDQEEIKPENINNPVLLPEDGFIRKNSKRR